AAVRVARGRIVDCGRGGTEVPVEPLGVWDSESVDRPQFIAGELIVAEVEEFVLLDRAADGAACLPVKRRRRAMCEEVSSLRVVVIAEEEYAPVYIVRARLECHCRDGAPGASKLGVEVARADADALDGVGSRDQHLKQPGLFIVIHTLDLEIVRHTLLAVDFRLQTILGVEELGVWACRPRSSRHSDEQTLKV